MTGHGTTNYKKWFQIDTGVKCFVSEMFWAQNGLFQLFQKFVDVKMALIQDQDIYFVSEAQLFQIWNTSAMVQTWNTAFPYYNTKNLKCFAPPYLLIQMDMI